MNFSLTILAICELFLPLVSFLILIFFGKRIGSSSHWVSITLIGMMLIIALTFFMKLFSNHEPHVFADSFTWFTTGAFTVYLGVLIDNTTVIPV